MFESAEQKLPLQIHGKTPGAGVNVFVTRHIRLQNLIFRLILKFVLVHGTAIVKILFPQLS